MKQLVTRKRHKGINSIIMLLCHFPKPAGDQGHKGINTYGFMPLCPTGSRGLS